MSNESDTDTVDWARRLSKRRRTVADVQQSALVLKVQNAGLPLPPPPDESLSKRQWELAMQQWRHAIRRQWGAAKKNKIH
jgi:hypothetical protein